MGLIQRKKAILLNEPHIITPASAGVVNFSTDMIAPLKQCKVSFSPVQSGSGDPNPVDNIRPISGWTGVDVYKSGKNLYDSTSYPLTNGYYINGNTGNTVEVANLARRACTFGFVPIPGLGGKTLTLNKRPGGNLPGLAFYSNSSGTFISGITNSSETEGIPWTFTVPENAKYIRFTVPIRTTDAQLEIGSSSTAYEPFKSIATYPISWASQGTLYGGYVDLITGILTSTHKIVTIQQCFNSDQQYAMFIIGNYGYIDTTDFAGMCNVLAPYTGSASTLPLGSFKILNSPGYNRAQMAYKFNGVDYSSAETVKSSTNTILEGLNNAGTPLQLCYKLASPVRYQLSTQTIKTLRGINNIWSDAGTVEIKYWKH